MDIDEDRVKLAAGALTALIMLGLVFVFIGGILQLIGLLFVVTGFLGNAGLLAYSYSQGMIDLSAVKPNPAGERQQDLEDVKRGVQGETPASASTQQAGPITHQSGKQTASTTSSAGGDTAGQRQQQQTSAATGPGDRLEPPTGGKGATQEPAREPSKEQTSDTSQDRMDQLQDEVSEITAVIQQHDHLENEQQILNRLNDAIEAIEQDDLDTAEQAITDMRRLLEQ